MHRAANRSSHTPMAIRHTPMAIRRYPDDCGKNDAGRNDAGRSVQSDAARNGLQRETRACPCHGQHRVRRPAQGIAASSKPIQHQYLPSPSWPFARSRVMPGVASPLDFASWSRKSLIKILYRGAEMRILCNCKLSVPLPSRALRKASSCWKSGSTPK